MNSIKARDLEKIRQILKRLEQGSKLSPSVPSDATHALEWRTDLAAEVRFLIEISEALAAITYKKGSVKDRFRDLPWHNLEYLHIVLKEALQASGASQDDAAESTQHRDVRRGLCAIAVPLIIKEDLPELHTRLSTLLRHQEEELAVFGGSITEESVLRTVVTAPPATGLVHLVKLTQHFMDEMQLRTLLGHMSPLTSSSYTGSRLQKYALMRLLTIVGESTKYMSPHLKAADPTIPWKNIEKVRDLLGHVSRVPIREAVQSILEEREVRGANLAEDATTVVAVVAAAGPPSEESVSPQATTTQTAKKNTKAKAKAKATSLKSEEGEELGFARTVIPLPPNLLRDVYERELVALGRKFDALRRHHASLLFEPASAHPFSFVLLITSLVFVAAAIFLFFTTPSSSSSSSPSAYLAAGVMGGVMFGVSAGPLWRDGGGPRQRRRRRGAAALWRALPRAAAYAPQSLALKRYSKLKERELEEKLRRDDDNARRRNNPDDDEVELMLRELATAMRQKRIEGGEGHADDDEGHDQADDDERAAAAAAVDVYRRALRRETQLDKAQAKELWALVTDKSARKRWAERLYGKARSTKRAKPKAPDHHHSDDDDDDDNAHHAYADAGEAQCHGKTGNSRKLARVRKLVALHQNSTLNKEGKRNHHDGDELGNFVLLRKFLQNPTETKEDQSTLCVKFIIATLREVQQLMADELPAFLAWALHSGGGGDDDEERRVVEEATRQIREHPLLQYALHFQIGLYALYAAQVKWWYPRLLGVEHIEMRDSVMHGTGHSYEHHLTDAGIAGMLGHLALMLRARAGLEAALLDLRAHAT